MITVMIMAMVTLIWLGSPHTDAMWTTSRPLRSRWVIGGPSFDSCLIR
jgi:hypothetical protein